VSARAHGQTALRMNTGAVTTSAPGVLPRWARIAGYTVVALLAVYGSLVVASELPLLTFYLVVAAVVVLDALLLICAARRRSLRVAVWCGVVAVLGAVVQAIWVYTVFAWDALPSFDDGFGWLGCGLAVSLLVTAGLLVRRVTRPFGWSVLMGSAHGFVTMFLLILAALSAFYAGD